MEKSTKNCLIVSSDADLKKELGKIIHSSGLKFSLLNNTQDLYSTLKRFFNVVILDLDNIETDAFELIENIKIFSPNIPIITISSNKKFLLAKKLIEQNVYCLINKPIKKEELSECLDNAVQENIDRITKSRMLKLAQQRAYDILLLKEIAESTTQKKINLTHLLDKIIDMIANLLDVHVVSIMMLNERKNSLKVQAYKGPRKAIVKGKALKVGEGVSGFVAKTKEPLLINNIVKNDKFSQSNWSKSYSTKSLLSVPIKLNENVLGIINVNNKIDNNEFNENDKNILVTISNQVAMAIENFKLYSNIKKKAALLEMSNKKLSDLCDAKTQLLCNLSHELKTPLTSVIGYLELLLTFSESDSEEEKRSFINIIHNESLEIAQLIERILNYFNLETNKIELEIMPLNLNDVINDIINQFKSKIERNEIVFKYSNRFNKIMVSADYKMLKTAIEQLFDNAIKFNDERCELTLKVEKVRKNKSNIVKVSIFNTGTVISNNEAEKIFEDFYQPGNILTEKPRGLGLGLATTREILKKHKGTVSLGTSNKRGNTFVCTIPLYKAPKGKST